MASYEDDHNISRPPSTPRAPRQRLDLSSFFESLNSQPTDGAQTDSEAPDAYRNLAEQFTHLPDTPLLQGLISQLLEGPKKAEGVPEGYFDTLERVDKKRLGEKTCPICAEKFADDPYPLVVQLPCHPTHWFDFACIQPWLQLQTTCPLDRLSVLPKPPPVPVEDSEEEYDEYYA